MKLHFKPREKLLSCSVVKRYILPNGIDTLRFGHYTLREDAMFREIIGDIEMGNDVLRAKKQKKESSHPKQANITKLLKFSSLDLGFFQNPITDDKIVDVINGAEMSKNDFHNPCTEPNKFSDMEGSQIPSNVPQTRE